MREIKQGGFSETVFKQTTLQQYIAEGQKDGCIFGYIGGHYRNDEKDRAVEQILAQHGYTPKKVAAFLISSDGRHLADRLEHLDSIDATAQETIGHFARVFATFRHAKGDWRRTL
jgi:hypothetical protein